MSDIEFPTAAAGNQLADRVFVRVGAPVAFALRDVYEGENLTEIADLNLYASCFIPMVEAYSGAVLGWLAANRGKELTDLARVIEKRNLPMVISGIEPPERTESIMPCTPTNKEPIKYVLQITVGRTVVRDEESGRYTRTESLERLKYTGIPRQGSGNGPVRQEPYSEFRGNSMTVVLAQLKKRIVLVNAIFNESE